MLSSISRNNGLIPETHAGRTGVVKDKSLLDHLSVLLVVSQDRLINTFSALSLLLCLINVTDV